MAIYNYDLGRYQLFRSNCLTFGNRHSIFAAQAVTEMLVALLVSAGVPVFGYVDDFIIFAPPHLMPIYFQFTKDVLQALGFELSPKASGCVLGKDGEKIELLGLDYAIS